MKTNFNISQDEKNRILEMHENRTKKLYLGEQQISYKELENLVLNKKATVAQIRDFNKRFNRQADEFFGVDFQTAFPKETQPEQDKYCELNKKAIIQIQKKLKSMGYPIGSPNPDGILGKQTLGSILSALDRIVSREIKPVEPSQPKELPTTQTPPQPAA
jgi:hypothetical protein